MFSTRGHLFAIQRTRRACFEPSMDVSHTVLPARAARPAPLAQQTRCRRQRNQANAMPSPENACFPERRCEGDTSVGDQTGSWPSGARIDGKKTGHAGEANAWSIPWIQPCQRTAHCLGHGSPRSAPAWCVCVLEGRGTVDSESRGLAWREAAALLLCERPLLVFPFSHEEGRLGGTGERGNVLPGFARVGGAVHVEIVGGCSHQGYAC